MSTASADDPLEESPIFDIRNLALIPIFTASLSVLGSYVVIRELWQPPAPSQTSMRAPLVRALMAMSFSDLLQAVALGFTTVPTPHWVTHVPFAIGNYTTCEMQGFFAQLGNVATPLFSTLLTFYYLVILIHQWSDNRIKQTEAWAHGSIWLVSIACSIFPVPLNLYNNAYHTCWINGYPEGCEYIHPDLPCERGGDYILWATIFTIFPLWPCLIAVLIMMCMIYSKIRTLEEVTAIHGASMMLHPPPASDDDLIVDDSSAFHEPEQSPPRRSGSKRPSALTQENISQTPAQESDDPRQSQQSEEEDRQEQRQPPSQRPQQQQLLLPPRTSFFSKSSGEISVDLSGVNRTRSRAVASQAFLFVMAFIMTHIFRLIATLWWTISEEGDEPWLYVIAYDIMICLQGFFNALVLLRTRKLQTPEGRFLQNLMCCRLAIIPEEMRRLWSPSIFPSSSTGDKNDANKDQTGDGKRLVKDKNVERKAAKTTKRGKHSSLPSGPEAIHSSVRSSSDPSMPSRGDRYGFFAKDSLGQEFDLSISTGMDGDLQNLHNDTETEQSLGAVELQQANNTGGLQSRRSSKRASRRRSSRKSKDVIYDVAEDDEFRHQPSEIILEEETAGGQSPRERPPSSDVTLDAALSSYSTATPLHFERETVIYEA